MDGFDLFKKLGSGTKLNYSRFKSDAEQLRIIKSRNKKSTESSGSVEKSNVNGSLERKRKLSESEELSSEDSPSGSESNFEEESKAELQLLGNIKSAGDGVPPSKKKKLKQIKKSSEKQAQIKEEDMRHFRRKKRIHIQGTDVPYPIQTFAELQTNYGLSSKLLENIQDCGYTAPTPIQMQALPIMLQQREILACAPTGSGKTAAFLIPVLHQLKAPKKVGFRALILSPTRELAQQTYRECKRLSEGLNLKIHVIEKASSAAKKFGPKTSQKFDILITTPNRLVYLLNQDPPVINLENVEWLVVDESDKLFEEGKTGFRDQLACIYKACSGKSVRHAMFSATFAHEVEQWCKLNLDNVIHIYIGAKNSATRLVEQELLFVGSEDGKLLAIRQMIKKGVQPPVLIFVQSKERAKELYQELIYDGINVDAIHADRTQKQRENVVTAFRSGKIWVLICTDLMGRGIDFKGINLVINYDFPNSAISYIHRIGRTGRAGRKGKAVTFFTEDDKLNLKSIANVIKGAGCPVPDYMLNMNRPKKDIRKKLAKSEMKRKTIRTFPQAEIVASRKRRQNTKKKKAQKQKGTTK